MTVMPQELYDEMTAALASAGREDLAASLRKYVRPRADLTSVQAARLLGVSSANTVKNWLKGGQFPGAYRTRGGHWRFPTDEVEAAKRRMEDLRAKNQTGDVTPPDVEDDGPVPLL